MNSQPVTDLYRRSELEVAADTVVAILASGLLPRTPAVVQALARHSRVPVDEIRSAYRRQERARPPRSAACEATRTYVRPKVTRLPPRARRTPHQRRCCLFSQSKDYSEFGRSPGGNRRPWCRLSGSRSPAVVVDPPKVEAGPDHILAAVCRHFGLGV